MKYRIKYSGTGGKWSGWRKTDKTKEELQGMVAHPKIQSVEWKEETK